MDRLALMTDRSERRVVVDRAWQRFIEDRIQPSDLPVDIQESWHRVVDGYHIDPELTEPRRTLRPDDLDARRVTDPILRLAEPILHEFGDHLTDHVVTYLDPEGWMLTLLGDPRTADELGAIHFRPGVNWSEDSAGTNAPGTALATGHPVEVFASEHFVHAWHSWSCAAVPLREPGEACPAGVIDVTGPWELQSRYALNLARVIARAVQERYRAARSIRDEVVRHALRAARSSGEAMVAVDPRGRVVGMNDAASRRGLAPGGLLAPELYDALGCLLRPGAPPDGEQRLRLQDGTALTAAAVQHESTAIGAIVRVLPGGRPARGSGATGVAQACCADVPAARYSFDRIAGASPVIRRAVDLARVASRNDLPVVISGESGTGKELFAHAIHAGSSRSGNPFVVVNCGAIPAELVEAELFGYEPGAFTGGRREGNSGRFEDASSGTIFLDEVSELPLAAQTALLRVLQEKEVVRLGGSTPRPVDVRVVAATNKPLDEEIRARRFRRDLFYRLNVLPIPVPPLRVRGDDIPLLAQRFLREAEAEVRRHGLSFAPDALDALRGRPWAGNVRELKNVVLRAAATAPANQISARDLQFDEPDDGDLPPEPPAAARGTLREAVSQSERARIVDALDACGWNVTRAAQQLGISRMTLYRMLSRYGISRLPERR